MPNDGLARILIISAIIVSLSLSQNVTLMRRVAAVPYSVSISNEQFNPQTVTIHAGDTVTWTNNDPFSYELYFTYASGTSYALSPFLQPGNTYKLGFPACNTFQYVTIESPVTITGTVKALLQGDVNGDGKVDIADLSIVGAHFQTSIGQAGYLPNADLDQDGIIDIVDLVLVASHFTQSCT
jgi:plastocyanin